MTGQTKCCSVKGVHWQIHKQLLKIRGFGESVHVCLPWYSLTISLQYTEQGRDLDLCWGVGRGPPPKLLGGAGYFGGSQPFKFLAVLLVSCYVCHYMFTSFKLLILDPGFWDSEDTRETIAFLQTRGRQRTWGEGSVPGKLHRVLLGYILRLCAPCIVVQSTLFCCPGLAYGDCVPCWGH